MFLLQVIPSLSSVFLLVVSCMMAVYLSDGISWLAVPDEHINVQQGRPIFLRWHYKMDDNKTFLSSKIGYFEESKLYTSIASRHVGENTYYKHQRNDFPFSVFGKNNVTLMVHSAEVGQNITYFCKVVWRSTAKKQNDKHCSKVFVYAVPRITYYTPQLSCKQGDSIKLQCNATGIPSPQVEWIHNDTHQRIGSSSHISLNITGKRSGGRYCCDADNGFGRDTACTVVNVTAPPSFITPLPTLYNMTISSITMKCETKGIPTPNITWISVDSGDIVSTGKYYNVSYVKCATKTMTFFCNARNEMGNISSPEIRVNVMTKHNCSTADKGLDETTPTALKLGIIAAITCACLIFVVGIVVVAVRFWRRIKASKVKNMDENTYQEPFDAVDLEREGSLSPARTTSTNDDYATVEECGVLTSLIRVKNNVHPAGEEPLYERLVPPA